MRGLRALLAAALLLACGPAATSEIDAESPSPPDAAEESCRTGLRGTVTAPNGIDPVPGAFVYVPRDPDALPEPGACAICDNLTQGASSWTQTEPNGTFSLASIRLPDDFSPGDLVTIVAQSGKFRRVERVPIQHACEVNAVGPDYFRLPSKTDGVQRVPNIAVADGSFDSMECVLERMRIDAEAIHIYDTFGFPGEEPEFDDLLRDADALADYDILFINCGNGMEEVLSEQLVRDNLAQFVRQGGRLYVTDWSYDFIEQVAELAPFIDFGPYPSGTAPEPPDTAQVGTSPEALGLVQQQELADWLRAVEDVTGETILGTNDSVPLDHFQGNWAMQYDVTDEATVWLRGQVEGTGLSGLQPLTTTFVYEGCGRALHSSYHTSTCGAASQWAPQERVLEYLIFVIGSCIVVQ